MDFKDWLPYIMAIISGVGSWWGSYHMSTKKAKQDLSALKEQTKLDIEKLMNQHKLDLEELKEKHNLQMIAKDKEQKHKLELIQKEHENELIRKEKELENTAKYSAMSGVFNGFMNGMFEKAINTPEIQSEITNKLREGFKIK